MKKQSGFTLIELMVVMAIIAILATAGLAAYTGYIKKARDTTRIADLAAINTIVLGAVGSTGKPPVDAAALKDLITAANNGSPIKDPLSTVGSGNVYKSTCLPSGTTACVYGYKTCNNGTDYLVGASFESASSSSTGDAGINDNLYEVGTCTSSVTYTRTGSSGTGSLTDDILDNDSI